MFRTDALENVLVWVPVKAAQGVPTEDIQPKGPAYLVPELFKPNRGVHFAFRLQEVHGFTEHNNPRLLRFRCFGCCFNGATNAPEKSYRVRQTIHHDR